LEAEIPEPDLGFFRVFLPYELLLAQRRAMIWGTMPEEELPSVFVGFYLLRLEPAADHGFPSGREGAAAIGDHLQQIIRSVIRDSDITGRLSDQEHLIVLRDVNPQQAYVVTQRLLTAASRSEILDAAGLATRVGYVVYPLSAQPDFPAAHWQTLIELARVLGRYGHGGGRASGFGVLRGPQGGEAQIPESDLIPLVFQDAESLVKAGVIRIQRIHLMPRS
jgi:hypothetical protein